MRRPRNNTSLIMKGGQMVGPWESGRPYVWTKDVDGQWGPILPDKLKFTVHLHGLAIPTLRATRPIKLLSSGTGTLSKVNVGLNEDLWLIT